MIAAKKISRRAFLAKAGGTVVGIGLPGIFVKLRLLIWVAFKELPIARTGDSRFMARWKDRPP